MRPYKSRRKAGKLVTGNKSYKIITRDNDPYSDEGVVYHRSKGWRRKRRKRMKEVTHKEYRAYRTWKYNRKTKWKN